jgi:hypothetical protein
MFQQRGVWQGGGIELRTFTSPLEESVNFFPTSLELHSSALPETVGFIVEGIIGMVVRFLLRRRGSRLVVCLGGNWRSLDVCRRSVYEDNLFS